MKKRYLLIINPRAGSAKEIESDLISLFSKKNIDLDVKKTRKPLDAKVYAKRAVGKYKVVIAAGGDGTINETINGLAGSDIALGIIPAGTENALAQGLNIPFDHIAAAKIIARGKVKCFDLGKAKGRYFILTAGVGLDATTVANIKPELKKLLGKHVYSLTTVQTVLTHTPVKLEIWLDDQVLPRWGYFVMISNVKHYGANMEIAQQAKPDDGYLDVCIFKRTDVINLLRYVISAKSKGSIPLTECTNMEYFKVKSLRITSKSPVLAHTDAELIGTTPITVHACPGAIKIIVN